MDQPLPASPAPHPRSTGAATVPHPSFWKRARKFAIAAAGVGGQAVTLALAQGLIPATAVPWVSLAVALGTAYGVWRIPNARVPLDDQPVPTEE